MNTEQLQRKFLPLFLTLLAFDYFAQLIISAGLVQFQPLLTIWYGPLDDIFYSMAGLQALHYLIDPMGETVDPEKAPTTMATVKTIAGLLGRPESRRRSLPQGFFAGSLRAVALVGIGLALAVLGCHLATSVALSSLLLLLQRHLIYLLPMTALVGFLLLWDTSRRPSPGWTASVWGGFFILLISMKLDGRWAHHWYHLFASLSNLQAWGAAFCWIGLGAALPGSSQRIGTPGVASPLTP